MKNPFKKSRRPPLAVAETSEAIVFILPRPAAAEDIEACALVLGATGVFAAGPEAVKAIVEKRSDGKVDPRSVNLNREGSRH